MFISPKALNQSKFTVFNEAKNGIFKPLEIKKIGSY